MLTPRRQIVLASTIAAVTLAGLAAAWIEWNPDRRAVLNEVESSYGPDFRVASWHELHIEKHPDPALANCSILEVELRDRESFFEWIVGSVFSPTGGSRIRLAFAVRDGKIVRRLPQRIN